MIYRREQPNTPAKRFRSAIVNPVGTKLNMKHFFKSQQQAVGTHFGKKICKRRKKTNFISKFNFNYGVCTSKPGVLTTISLARRYKTFAGLLVYSNGMMSCLPLFNGANLGYVVRTWEYKHTPKLFFFSSLKTGYTVPVAYLSITMCFFNVMSYPLSQHYYCRAGGTFCILVRYSLEKGICTIKLPSAKLKVISETSYVMLGRNSNTLAQGVWHGKAGFSLKAGFRPAVRGVAKNPVDHPHGGRTKTNTPERTPWGRVAKFNK